MHTPRILRVQLAAGALLALASGCPAEQEAPVERAPKRSLVVTASAYNSVAGQTGGGDPALTAWGDELTPGVKAIAVSRDLIALGLTHGVEVEIEGLPGSYRVLDKMNKRWRKKIDIYMGRDVEAARAWGVKRVRIRWDADQGAAGR